MTKSSSSRKHQGSRSRHHSKMSLLRRKLTLGDRRSPAAETVLNSLNEQPIDEQNTHQTKPFHRTSPMKLVRLYKSMTTDQVQLIKSWGYGGLVEIKCSKLQPDLCKFLVKSFDPSTCKLVFPGRGSIDVSEASVHKVMGVPKRDIDVRYERDADAINFMNKQLGNSNKLQPKISFLEKKLAAMNTADTTYLRLFITYSMCSVIAPTTGTRLSPRVYLSLVRIKQCNRLNMCKFIISMLQEAAKSRAEVKYLDSLELKYMDIRTEGTRVSVWTNAMVKQAISQDQRSDGTFGLASLKVEFSSSDSNQEDTHNPTLQADIGTNNMTEEHNHFNKEEQYEDEELTNGSILFSDENKIDMFIQKQAPSDRTPEEIQSYRQAVQDACHNFEFTLQMLVTTLSFRPV